MRRGWAERNSTAFHKEALVVELEQKHGMTTVRRAVERPVAHLWEEEAVQFATEKSLWPRNPHQPRWSNDAR